MMRADTKVKKWWERMPTVLSMSINSNEVIYVR